MPAASTFREAQSVGTAELRTLDALHLATALEIGPELEGILTYDKRLASSAAGLGVTVTAPGLPDRWWTVSRFRQFAAVFAAELPPAAGRLSGTTLDQGNDVDASNADPWADYMAG